MSYSYLAAFFSNFKPPILVISCMAITHTHATDSLASVPGWSWAEEQKICSKNGSSSISLLAKQAMEELMLHEAIFHFLKPLFSFPLFLIFSALTSTAVIAMATVLPTHQEISNMFNLFK